MRNFFFISILLACFASLTTGCRDNGPRLVPATGTVTFGGAPLTGASIIIHYPDRSTATGRTDGKGFFTVVYSNGQPGAAPGNGLKVSVTKTDEQGVAVTGSESPDPGSMKDIAMKGMSKTADGRVQPVTRTNFVPPKYADPNSSGITVDIPPEGKKDLKIELSS